MEETTRAAEDSTAPELEMLDAIAQAEAAADTADTAGSAAAAASKKDASPAQRIAELLSDMGPQKPQLLAIIDFCKDQERTSDEIDEMLQPFWEHRMSVYDGMDMRAMLEEAGALIYISNDEEPDEVYGEDGSLVLPEQATATWLATADGVGILAEQDPYRDLEAILAETKVPTAGFALVLALCSAQGQPVSAITERLNASGLLEGTEYDPTLYVSKLEDAGALEWQGGWITTDLGKRYLAQIQG